MTLKGDAKVEEKLTCVLENDRNMVNFQQSDWKSQNWFLMVSFNPKQDKYELEIHRGLMCHENEE